MDKNKELAELLGLCWHEAVELCKLGHIRPSCTCGYSCKTWAGIDTHIKANRPDFTTDAGKVQLLRLMMDNQKWIEQFELLPNCWLLISYITDTTGKLRDVCLDWMRKEGRG